MSRAFFALVGLASGCSLMVPLDDLEGGGDGTGAGCATGRADCDGNAANGCETDIRASVDACGACGVACPDRPSAVAVCESGVCGLLCDTFRGDCDGDPQNGCETATDSDVAHCGSCGHVCGDENAISTSCDAGECVVECEAGFASCDENDATGCEVDLMSDPDHCGRCGHGCEGGACVSGACQVVTIATRQPRPHAIAVGGGFVYWATSEDVNCNACGCDTLTKIVRAPLAGGPVEIVVEPTEASRMAVGPDGILYWVGGGRVNALGRNGAPVELASGQSGPDAIAVDAQNVYWTGGGRLKSVAVGGGMPLVMVDGNVSDVALVIDATSAYFHSGTQPKGVKRLPLGPPGLPVPLVPEDTGATDIAVDGTSVYWTIESDDAVFSAPLGGAPMPTELFKQKPEPTELVVGGAAIHFWSRGTGTLVRINLDGTGQVDVATEQPSSASLASDVASVYWTNENAGTVSRLAQ